MRLALRPPLLCLLMLTGAVFAAELKPTELLANRERRIDLARMVPLRFGDWRALPSGGAQIVDPGQQAVIDTIYTETLTRTYRNSQGYLMMLSIAYGKDQRDALQVHRPEICYPAQGFTLLSKDSAHFSGLPVTRLQTSLGSRHEPVTYWTMIGDNAYVGSLSKKLNEIRYGFAGTIPDGMLVRISSLDRDAVNAFKQQETFAQAMIDALPAEVRRRFAGSYSSGTRS